MEGRVHGNWWLILQKRKLSTIYLNRGREYLADAKNDGCLV